MLSISPLLKISDDALLLYLFMTLDLHLYILANNNNFTTLFLCVGDGIHFRVHSFFQLETPVVSTTSLSYHLFTSHLEEAQ